MHILYAIHVKHNQKYVRFPNKVSEIFYLRRFYHRLSCYDSTIIDSVLAKEDVNMLITYFSVEA